MFEKPKLEPHSTSELMSNSKTGQGRVQELISKYLQIILTIKSTLKIFFCGMNSIWVIITVSLRRNTIDCENANKNCYGRAFQSRNNFDRFRLVIPKRCEQ